MLLLRFQDGGFYDERLDSDGRPPWLERDDVCNAEATFATCFDITTARISGTAAASLG